MLTPEWLEWRLAGMTIFVASDATGESLEPYLWASRPATKVTSAGMAVRSDWQGRGVAEALLQRAESELRKRKCSRLSLDTTVPLQRAIRFYEKHGFRPSGTVEDFFGMPLFE